MACAFLQTVLWIYSQISSGVIYTSKWPSRSPRVKFKFPAQILHLKTKISWILGWLEIFVLEHQPDQLWNKMPSALVNAHIIEILRRQTHRLVRLHMTDQQALSLSNHQGSLLIHSDEETVGKVLLIKRTRNWLGLRRHSNLWDPSQGLMMLF